VLKKGGVLVISTLEQNNMCGFYSDRELRTWITGILGEQAQASARLQRDGFIWGDTGRWHEYGIAIMTDDWIAKRFEAAGIHYRGTKRAAHSKSQHYKYGVKNGPAENPPPAARG
jgi:hypothetical protein